MVVVPQEIIDSIIEEISDKGLLKRCALVSSSFLVPSRKRLFSSISLTSDQSCQRLYGFLVENPVLQSSVRSITLDWRYVHRTSPFKLNGTSLIAILRLPFCRLTRFSIHKSHRSNQWGGFSSELKDALAAIIHSPTLKTLKLDHVLNMPIMLFQGIHLTALILSDVFPNEFDAQSIPTGMTPTSHTVIDQCEWSIYSALGPTEPVFMPFMCRLRVLEIYIDPFSTNVDDFHILSVMIRSLCISLTSPATLEHLKISIVLQGAYDVIDYYSFLDDLRGADVWRHLDFMSTQPMGSRLQRVDINLEYSLRDDLGMDRDETEVGEPVLDALPLLREKGILFVEATTG